MLLVLVLFFAPRRAGTKFSTSLKAHTVFVAKEMEQNLIFAIHVKQHRPKQPQRVQQSSEFRSNDIFGGQNSDATSGHVFVPFGGPW